MMNIVFNVQDLSVGMKIAIIAPGLPTRGGAGRYTWELSEHFVSKNDHVSII